MSRPLILVTNDDSFKAPGIKVLIDLAKEHGDVVVVAPDAPQSGQSSALTVLQPVRAELKVDKPGFKLYRCTGTPVDCVKLALDKLLDKRPDFILSGINHGSNASVNVLYSGTMAAAIEGAVVGIPSIGFSITSHSWEADFAHTIPYCKQIVEQVLRVGMPKGTCLNVNVPEGEIKGVKICRQAKGYWFKEFVANTDPRGQKYYWLTGDYQNIEPQAEDTDIWALDNGYVSIVPIATDMTNYEYLGELEKENL